MRALNASSPSFTIWTGDWLTTRVRPERFFTAAAAVRSSAWPHAELRLRVSVATLKTWTQTFTSVDLQFSVQPSETNADVDAARDCGRPHRRVAPPLSFIPGSFMGENWNKNMFFKPVFICLSFEEAKR